MSAPKGRETSQVGIGGGPRVRPDDRVIDDSHRSIDLAVTTLRAGSVVALPTETVYGLAADASNPAAVRRVFELKGRPCDHPLIAHLGLGVNLSDWARRIPEVAIRLAETFWPGPLTMVLERSPSVLDEVTGGLDTVALRVPHHTVALRILKALGGGLAAPSANRFGRVSPTTAYDVVASLGVGVDLVVDGGPCRVGIESTIVAFDGQEVVILRPGGVSPEAIARVIGYRTRIVPELVRAPGSMASHYAPAVSLELRGASDIVDHATRLVVDGRRVGVLSLAPVRVPGATLVWDAEGDMALFAHLLYAVMRQADAEGLDVLAVELPPDEGLGVAIRDRLCRAAVRSQQHDKEVVDDH